ncbi:cytoplasmic dynein 1 intermediate chain-like isoform X1 [Diprion similis]|uniref:cytoplasmic dynein 1 intermediate chain-like isoform X1 n=1 Tax=Diprion similis TaxID=362088 RepID=UPI001EF823F6|nr:cytoplasmic dynein 1 intermediate chain-like isoform X1 [Diprion similis]XP_046744159.1 cytoplasmic dynein 1 intermediate chain-like isoform X1 [Diprion similis]XP_046744168.1 cytoplasmic dynein 1 intermediate chain-like isoform X1 [Diprion similis]XP_046744177.1 cytoplasmic dynein 1 intermediate chain-like isoform X1 [Diprion similis]XP_046744187.1 cytoplasmic dynein 1 intermediate chain-like isoform X1 [Diprion similis]
MMSDRKAELERKKAKLQAIREEKERRRKEKEQKDVEEATVRAAGADKDHRKDLDAMLSSLGVAPVSDVLSSLSSMNSLTPEQSANATPDASLQPSSINSVQSIPGRRKAPRDLTAVSVAHTDIPPKEAVVYSKQTQTAQTAHTSHDGLSTSSSAYSIFSSCSTTTPTHSCSAGYFETDWWRPRKGGSAPNYLSHAFGYYDEYNLNPGLEWEDEFTVLTFDDGQAEDEESSLPHMDGFQSKLPPGILPHGLPQVKEVQPAVTQVEQEKEKEKPKEVRELSEEEKLMTILSEEFQRFLDRSSRVVERALGESVDIYTDYTGIIDGEDGIDEKSHQRLSLNRSFFCDRWSRNRCITSLDWSPQFPELLAASYKNNDDTPNDPDGVCLIWNTKFKKTTPEYIFHCQSSVMATTFARFHPNLILGGTYSGQIVLWDNRVQKRTPIQRTPLSASAHTHPVYCLSVVGTQNAHNLISISTDGKLCSWNLDMLSHPQETLELQARQSKPVAVTSLAFPSGDVNNFIVGSEDGTVYSACRHGTKAGVTETYEGHLGPVTGVSAHAVQGGIDFSHLFLTSSIDWTIKLWSLKENKPLYSFEHNGDYVYDVAWSPTHPALFAAVDGSGRLDLWNLNQDTEVPAASVIVDGCPALNTVSWTPSGLHVTVGDDTGKIWVYDVAENFAHPRIDEWNNFLYTQQDLKNNKADEELDKLNLSSGPSSLISMPSLSGPIR